MFSQIFFPAAAYFAAALLSGTEKQTSCVGNRRLREYCIYSFTAKQTARNGQKCCVVKSPVSGKAVFTGDFKPVPPEKSLRRGKEGEPVTRKIFEESFKLFLFPFLFKFISAMLERTSRAISGIGTQRFYPGNRSAQKFF